MCDGIDWANIVFVETVRPEESDSFATSLSFDVCAFPTSFFIDIRVFEVSDKAIFTP